MSVLKSKPKTRWTREFKPRALARMAAAPDVTALAKDLGVDRELLYVWRRKFRSGGAEALHPIGRRLASARPFDEASAASSSPASDAELRRIEVLERKACPWARPEDRPATTGAGFFSRSLAACQGTTPHEGRTWRDAIYAGIRAQMGRQGEGIGIERMCALAGVSRALNDAPRRRCPRTTNSFASKHATVAHERDQTCPRRTAQCIALARSDVPGALPTCACSHSYSISTIGLLRFWRISCRCSSEWARISTSTAQNAATPVSTATSGDFVEV